MKAFEQGQQLKAGFQRGNREHLLGTMFVVPMQRPFPCLEGPRATDHEVVVAAENLMKAIGQSLRMFVHVKFVLTILQ